MAKIFGLNGALKGKQGNNVFRVKNGVQYVAAYQPVVYNPNTLGQVAARAKFKLLSQVAEIVAPYLGFARSGAVSPRNTFVKKNYALTSYSDDKASMLVQNMDLSGGVISLTGVSATRAAGTGTLEVTVAQSSEFNSIMVVVLTESAAGLRVAGARLFKDLSQDNTWTVTFSTSNNAVMLAYGIRVNTEAARVRFEDIDVDVENSLAFVEAIRSLTANDISLSETIGNLYPAQA